MAVQSAERMVATARGRRGRFRRIGSALGWFGLLAGSAALPLHAGIPAAPGWQQVFGDDFDGRAGQPPDRATWRFGLGHGYPGGPPDWGTHEVQRYTAEPANIGLDGRGHLRIAPRRDAAGQWTSARIETPRDDFRPPDGGVLRMEARLRMPDVEGEAALGYWPAFWALGESFRRLGEWPQSGEFDIMENVNGVNLVWGTLHCGVAPAGPCDEPDGMGQHMPCEGTPCQGGFHTYTFEWDRSTVLEALRWYLDGKLYGVITRDRLPPATWRQITGQRGYFLLLDVAMGGDFAYAISGGRDTPVAATEPGHAMVVDYVAVWTRSGAR